jgi:hypothetical protein
LATAFTTGDFIATTTNTSAEAGAFVPEHWSSEVIAPYKKNRVLANLVTVWGFEGDGDTINVPTFVRGSAQDKSKESVVQPNVTNSTLTTVTIDKHIEYSVLIEDFAKVQAMSSMRRAYVDDAGYAIARKKDWDLHMLGRTTGTAPVVGGDVTGTDYGDAVIGSDGTTAWAPAGAGNAASLADAGIRRMIRTLDDNDVPSSDRAWVIPPVEKESLMGLPRFTEQAFTGESGGRNTIRNGVIGDLYGDPVAVSSNCPNVLDGGSSNDQRAGLYLHKGAFVLVEQMKVRAQAQNLLEFLSTLLVWDTIYGVQEVRATNVIPFIVPA